MLCYLLYIIHFNKLEFYVGNQIVLVILDFMSELFFLYDKPNEPLTIRGQMHLNL